MKHIVKTENEWLALRKKYITASNAAVLVGADPYSSPKSITEASTFTGNAYTKVGQLLEPIVVEQVNKHLNTSFALYEINKDEKEFYTCGHFGATPDAHLNRTYLLECKTVNTKTYLKYSSVPPSKYLIQLIIQAMCIESKEKYHYLAMLDTGLKTMENYEAFLKNPELDKKRNISVFKIGQNDELCTILKTEAQRFNYCVANGKQFRVASKVKQKVALMLLTMWEKIL